MKSAFLGSLTPDYIHFREISTSRHFKRKYIATDFKSRSAKHEGSLISSVLIALPVPLVYCFIADV